MKRPLIFAALSVLASLAVSGCHNTNSPSPDSSAPGGASSSQSGPAPSPQTVPSANTPTPTRLVIYVLNPKAAAVEDVLMPHSVPLLHPETPAKDAIDALLQSSQSPIAPGTALRGISVDGSLATLDFSQSPVRQTGGESGQSAAMNSLAMTLGQFPEISTFQIKVKGHPVTTFGEFTTDGPQNVIRPGELAQAKGSGQ